MDRPKKKDWSKTIFGPLLIISPKEKKLSIKECWVGAGIYEFNPHSNP